MKRKDEGNVKIRSRRRLADAKNGKLHQQFSQLSYYIFPVLVIDVLKSYMYIESPSYFPALIVNELWDGAKKLDTTISQEAILKDTGVTRKCDNIQKNSNAK